MIGAGFGLGFIIGPAIGGLLAGHGPQMPFLAAAAFSLANFLFGLFVLPESLPSDKRRDFNWRALNPFRSLRAMSRVRGVGLLVVVYFLLCLAGQTHPTMWTLYTQHRFGWGPAEVGLSLAVVGILHVVSQGLLTGPTVKRFGERAVLVWGCAGETLSFVAFGTATRPWMMYATLIVGSLFWAAQPALQSLITRDVPENEQGEFQGALVSLMSIASILNPLVMTSLFSLTSVRDSGLYLPGSPYLLGAVLLLGAWAAAWRWEHPAEPVSSASVGG
jgi:DHA1 family tetracycline resistance protein-like MFS transporter